MTRHLKTALSAAVAALTLAPALAAQRAAAVPRLDLNQITGTWYQIARLPDKPERKCVSDGMILYALSDKPRSFQQGLFCKIKGGDAYSANSFGRQDKHDSGLLKVSRLFIFSTKYLVLAVDPGYTWALVGTSNHKTLWLLARTPTLDAATRARLETTATAQGYKSEKLMNVPHTVITYRAEGTPPIDGANGTAIPGAPPAAPTP